MNRKRLTFFLCGFGIFILFLNNLSSVNDPLHFVQKIPDKKFVFIGILSSEFYNERREAIRNYVIKQVINLQQKLPYTVKYKFFLDQLTNETILENEKYGDIVFMNSTTKGYANRFGYKLQWFYRYTAKNYPDIHLIGRMDDDTFLCVEHLFLRLKYVENPLMFYGWKTIRNFVDEQMFFIGRELLNRLVKREYCQQKCNNPNYLSDHAFGTIALQDWLKIYNDINFVYDNHNIFQCLWRKINKQTQYSVKKQINFESFCKYYVSYHKADINVMEYLYNHTMINPPRGKILSPGLFTYICFPELKHLKQRI